MEAFEKLFTDLEERWGVFKNNQEDEKFVVKEITNLLQLTLLANLDVSDKWLNSLSIVFIGLILVSYGVSSRLDQ